MKKLKKSIEKQKKFKQKRKWWFRGLKQVLKIRYKKPLFIYLGEKPTNSAIILSNHEGTEAPMSLEIYCDFPIRMWGTAEMNSGLRKLYKYQTEVYYHQKKHWNLFAARMFCLLASPLTNLFYKGLNLISTYQDARLKTTLSESVSVIKNGENIVIFPEKSIGGYHAELKGFYAGFILLAKQCLKQGIDVPIFVSYYKVKERKYIFDKPILFSRLQERFSTREQMTDFLLDRCNQLGKMDL
ncbi:MAG TPA: hypothetical protein GX745_01515 [Clostridiales bacterium]|nr:hypothetical protein [Clostridiales bacterium]